MEGIRDSKSCYLWHVVGSQEDEDRIKVGNGFCKEVTSIFVKKCSCGISMDYQKENEFFEEMDFVKQIEKVLIFGKWSGFSKGKKLNWSTYEVGPQKDALYLNMQIMESAQTLLVFDRIHPLIMWCRTFRPWEQVRIDIGQTHRAQLVMGQHYLAFCMDLVLEEPLLYVLVLDCISLIQWMM